MKVDKNQLQEMYTEYQLLMQQLQQLQENLQTLQKHVIELTQLKENINNIIQLKLNEETLMPFGSGIFLKGEIKDTKNVIMNVGSNVFVEKTTQEAIETVNKQMKEVSDVAKQMEEEIGKTSARVEEIQEQFQKIKPEEMEE